MTRRKDYEPPPAPPRDADDAEAIGRREYYVEHESVCHLALRTEGCVRVGPSGRRRED